jgi:putative chitinase
VNLDDLKHIAPHANDAVAIALLGEMPRWGIDRRAREAAFLANVLEETAGLAVFEEQLHYKDAKRAKRIFAKHLGQFSDADVAGYLEAPEMFASRIYANRMGNGPEASGDGWRYRGRGCAQLTGKDAYALCGKGIGADLVAEPDLLLVPKVSVQSACWFWKWKGIAGFADAGDFEGVVKKWNGGLIGLTEREDIYGKLQEVIA